MPPGGGFDAGSVHVTLAFDVDDASLRKFDEQVRRARQTPDVKQGLEFKVDDAAYKKFMAQVAGARAMPDIKVHVKVEVDNRPLRRVREEATLTQRALSLLKGGTDDAGGGFRLMGNHVSKVFTLLTVFNPLIQATGGALLGLVSSLASAAGGLGALGAAAGGVAIPVLGVLVGAFQRVSKVMDVYKSQQADAQAASVAGAKATSTEADSQDSLAGALDGVKSAREALAEAQRAHGRAIAEQRAQVRQARDEEVKAARDVSDAQRELADARRDAQRASEDANRAAEDAAIGLSDAQNREDELRAQGVGGRSLFDAQRDVGAAAVEARRTEEERQGFVERGARAYGPLVAALRQVSDAERALSQRRHDLTVLDREGIRGSDRVRASVLQVTQARRALAAALRAQAAAQRQADSGGASSTAGAKTSFLTAGLSGAERGLLATINRVRDRWRAATQEGTDAFISGMDRALGRVPRLLDRLRPQFAGIGDALGDEVDKLSEDLTGPTWTRAWQKFGDAAEPILHDLGRITRDWLAIFRDIGLAALPDLKKSTDDSADSMDHLAARIHRALGDGSLGKTVHGMVESFRDWWRLIKQVGGLLMDVFGASKDDGDSMVESLTKTVKKWREWIQANPDKVRKFLQDSRDAFKAIWEVAGPVVEAYLKIGRFFLARLAGLNPTVLSLLGTVFAGIAILKFTGALSMLRLLIRAYELFAKHGPIRLPGGTPGPGAPTGGPTGTPTGGRPTGGPTRPTSSPVRGGGGAAAVVIASAWAQRKIDEATNAPAPGSPADRATSGGAQRRAAEDSWKWVKGATKDIADFVTGAKDVDSVTTDAGDALGRLSRRLEALADKRRDLRRFNDTVDDVRGRFSRLRRSGSSDLRDLEGVVDRNTKEIRDNLDTRSRRGARAINENFDQAVEWIRKHMRRAGKLTEEGAAAIERIMRSRLAAYGITGATANAYIHPKAAGTDSGPLQGNQTSQPRQASGGWGGMPAAVYGGIRAATGWIGRMGEKGADLVHAIVGRGEAILNHYQQSEVDQALWETGRGGLGDLFDRTRNTRHYLSSGGFAGRFASGGRLGFSGLQRLWTRNRGPGGSSDMAAAVAMAESGGRRDATNRNTDGSIDRGYWQINSIHGALSTYDPDGNARAAVSISSRGRNWNPWTTFKNGAYLQFLRGGPGQGGGGPEDRPIAKIALPALMGRTAADAMVSGALRGVTRGANAVLARADGTDGSVGGPASFRRMVDFADRLDAMRIPYGPQGHARWAITRAGEDCSSTVSKVLHAGGALRTLSTTVTLPSYLRHGRGSRVTVHDRPLPGGAGHTIVELGGRFFGTSGSNPGGGPGWIPRPAASYLAQLPLKLHPKGFAAGRRGALARVGRPAKPAPQRAASRPLTWQDKFQLWRRTGRRTAGLFNTVEFALGAAGVDRSLLSGGPDTPPADYRGWQQDVARFGTQLGVESREFDRMQGELVDPTTGEVNEAVQRAQVAKQTRMLRLREQIKDRIERMIEKARQVAAAYQAAIAKLRDSRVMEFATSPVSKALGSRLATWGDNQKAWGDELWTLQNETLPMADMDVDDVRRAIDAILHPEAGGAGSTADNDALLAQAQEVARVAQAVARVQAGAIAAFGSGGDVGAGAFRNAFDSAAGLGAGSAYPAGGATVLGGGSGSGPSGQMVTTADGRVLQVVYQSYVPPSPAEAQRLAAYTAEGLSNQGAPISPRVETNF